MSFSLFVSEVMFWHANYKKDTIITLVNYKSYTYPKYNKWVVFGMITKVTDETKNKLWG